MFSFSILFAEHFSPENAFSLIADAMREKLDDRLKITFLSSDPKFKHYFTAVIRSCLGDVPILDRLSFVTLMVGQRMRDALKSYADGSDTSYFDYVEYFNGISLSTAHDQHLADLKEVCTRNE